MLHQRYKARGDEMITVHLLLIVLAIVFAGLATFKVPEPTRLSYIAGAVFVYMLATLVSF